MPQHTPSVLQPIAPDCAPVNHTQSSSTPPPFPHLWVAMLGVMIAIGPLAIDMYLPALPMMAHDLGISHDNASRSLPFYFIGLVLGQLIYGPVSDRIGRIRPLYVGMTMFLLASVVCALATSASVLFGARLVQALGVSVTTTVSRAMIRDTMDTKQMARAFSLMVLVMGVAPIFAPSIGALILRGFEWRALFWFMAGYGVLNLALTLFYLQETLPKARREKSPIWHSFAIYIDILKDKSFLTPALAGGLLMGAFFIYLSASSSLFMEQYGVSAQKFALLFSANAFGFIAMTQVNQRLTRHFSLHDLLWWGAWVQFVAALCGFVLSFFIAPLWAVVACIFVGISGLGLTQPNAGAIALDQQRRRAGAATAMQGALQFAVGIFGGFLLTLVAGTALFRLSLFMMILAGLALILIARTRK